MLGHIRDRVRIFRHRGEYADLHDLVQFYVYLLIVWGFYRALFRFPVILRIRTDGKTWGERLKSVGITWKNLFAALAFGLSLGVFYLFVGRMGQFFRFGSIGQNPYGS